MRIIFRILLCVLIANGSKVAFAGAVGAEPSVLMARAVNLPMTDIVKAGNHYIAVGAKGVVLTSEDGIDWQQVPTPVNRMLTSAHFVNSRSGWAVGHDQSILHTNDGGKSWLLQQHVAGDTPLLDVLFLDAYRGVAVGAFGSLFLTNDSGENWSSDAQSEFNPMGYHLNGLARLGNGRLMVVGEFGLVGISTDGIAWQSVPLPYSGSLFDVAPVGQQGAIVAGMRGNVYWTPDVESQQWNKVDVGGDNSIFAVKETPEPGKYVLVGANNTVLEVLIDLSEFDHTVRPLATEIEDVLVFSGLYVEKNKLLLVNDHGPALLK